MDQSNSGKDTPVTPIRPNRAMALSHIFLGLGIFMMAMMLFRFVFTTLSDVEVMDLDALLTETSPIALKLLNFFSSSLPMLFAAFLGVLVIKANPRRFLLLNLPRNAKWFMLSFVFVVVTIFLLPSLLELNSMVDFTRWPELNDWLLRTEELNNKMYEAMLGEKGPMSLITSILFMALIPALGEEFFFRGFLMNVMHGLFRNIHVAIIVTALLFSLLHMQFLKFIPMFAMAIAFGYSVYWTRSVWTSVLIHFLNNALTVIQLYYVTGGDYERTVNEGTQFPWYFVAILVALFAGLFIYIQRNSDTKTPNFYE